MNDFLEYFSGLFSLSVQWFFDCFRWNGQTPGLGAVVVAVSVLTIVLGFLLRR